MEKRLQLFFIFLFTWFAGHTQRVDRGDLLRKNLSDTILGRRTMVMPDPFNARLALLRLFPGKWYDLSTPGDKDQLISWICHRCKPMPYPDVNGDDGDSVRLFPDPGGEATRLINVFSYKDSSGRQYKVMSFNHSMYDPDGLQTGRFTGGLLGMAKFVRADSGWRLQVFQPAIAAYGSFSGAPAPEPLLIGKDQWAFMIDHVNGPPGGPFWGCDYLIAEVDGSYRQILVDYATTKTAGDDSQSFWKVTYTTVPGGTSSFRDIVFTYKGHYFAADTLGMKALPRKVGRGSEGNFTAREVFRYMGKEYREK